MPNDAAPPPSRRSYLRWSWSRLWRGFWRGLLGLLVLGALGGVVFYFVAVQPDRRSVPYHQAMQRLHANRSALHLLGPPVGAGWWVRGHASADSVRLAVPVKGARREGTLHVAGAKVGSAWVFSRLELDVTDNNLRLSLLEKSRRRHRAEGPPQVPPRYRK